MDAAAHALKIAGAQMEFIQFYDPAAFLRCITENRGILLNEYWHDINVQLKIVPIEWDYYDTYGFFVKRQCNSVFMLNDHLIICIKCQGAADIFV